MLKLEAFRMEVGRIALDADLVVRSGERTVLVGPSGSGKTSFLRAIAGLDPGILRSGRVMMNDIDLTSLPPEDRNIGFVFQDQALFPSLNLFENVTFGLRMRGVSRAERKRLALEWLRRVGIDHDLTSSVGTLSGGERQRVAFVRALIWKPDALLLDEPFSALDPSLRCVLRRELLQLLQSRPIPVILVSHDEQDFRELGTSRLEIHGSAVKYTA